MRVPSKMVGKKCNAKWITPLHSFCAYPLPYIHRLRQNDDVIEWKLFAHYWTFCGEFIGHRSIPRRKARDAELWCFPGINGWVNNREAVDLRRHRAHYDAIVMIMNIFIHSARTCFAVQTRSMNDHDHQRETTEMQHVVEVKRFQWKVCSLRNRIKSLITVCRYK